MPCGGNFYAQRSEFFAFLDRLEDTGKGILLIERDGKTARIFRRGTTGVSRTNRRDSRPLIYTGVGSLRIKKSMRVLPLLMVAIAAPR